MEKETLPPLKTEEHAPCTALGTGPEAAVASRSSSSAGRKPSGQGERSGGDGGIAERDGSHQMGSKSGSADAFRARGESKSQDSVLSSSARARSFGPSSAIHGHYGLVSPDFPSLAGTPSSISQLLNLPSSTFSFEGLEFPSPLGSGIISPLTSTHKLGRKRPISISPLSSSSQLDLNSLIRTSSSSLVNCLPTTSRDNSAGSMGHLSPSLFANPSVFATPHRAPLFSLRNAAHPAPPPATSSFSCYPSRSSGSQSDAHRSRPGGPDFIKEEPVEESIASQPSRSEGAMLHFTANSQESGFNSQPRELETLHEEDVLSEDEMQTDPSNSGNYSSALTEDGEAEDSKEGILDNRPRRVYYSYPSVEEPHNNTCRWGNCDVQCQDLNDLVRHVNNDHIYRDSKKEFVCQWSGCVRGKKPFKAQYMLLVHMRRHTGEKPHKCTYEGCHKAYSRLENLKTHLRSHTGERPYVCKYEGCGKAFSNASDCAKHMNRTHSNEKPYACLNPGCTKRYTDPSSRRKHMKNCQVNKKARMEDCDVLSPGDEESSVETASVISKSTASSSSSAKTIKSKKPEKKKPPFGQKMTIKGGPHTGADLGYISGGSQGQPSPLKGYGSSGYDGESHNWQGEDEISTILRQQTLSDPKDPTSPMSVGYPPPGGQYPGTTSAHMASQMVPMDQVSSHVTENPNVKASRQRGGGLNMPAGRTPGNPPQSHPMKTLHHLPSALPHPPPSYHQPPLYSPSRPNQFLPSYPSYQSGYSSLPAESRPPQPPSSVPYTHLPASARGENENNPPINSAHPSSTGNQGDLYDSHLTRKFCGTSSSSGYSSCYSPKGGGNVHRKSPSDDGSVLGAALQNNLMTTSYSTFSSNSSRVSTPSNSGRGDGVHAHHLQQSALHNQFMPPKTSPRGDQAQNFPLEHAMRMSASYPHKGDVPYSRRQMDEVSRSSGRSWHFSSQSSQFSYTGSEFSDEAIENLPTDIRRDGFTKTTPLPLPESMQDQFDAPLKMGTGMDYSPSQGNGPETVVSESGHYPHPNSPMQMDFQGDKTMPLYHLPPESGYIPNDTHLPFFSNSQCTTDYDLAYFGGNNMVIADMATISNTLPDETECLEKLLSFQTS